jgi:hypothetical protein
LDDKTKADILHEHHDSLFGGQRGMNETYEGIKEKYTWPTVKNGIDKYVKKCGRCQVNKLLGPKKKVSMKITTIASQPFDKCKLDTVGPLVESVSRN